MRVFLGDVCFPEGDGARAHLPLFLEHICLAGDLSSIIREVDGFLVISVGVDISVSVSVAWWLEYGPSCLTLPP